jgi:hypothetical protein
MSAQTAALEAATIGQQCKVLHLPTVAVQCAQLAEQALRERRSHLGFLEALLQAELEEREQRLVERRIREARLPRMKLLEEFDFAQCPKISPQQIHELAEGGYIERAEPIILIGDSRTDTYYSVFRFSRCSLSVASTVRSGVVPQTTASRSRRRAKPGVSTAG